MQQESRVPVWDDSSTNGRSRAFILWGIGIDSDTDSNADTDGLSNHRNDVTAQPEGLQAGKKG